MRVFLLALLLLCSCATTSSTPPIENTAVTKTLLVSQEYGRFQDPVALSTDQFGNTYVVDRAGPSIIKYTEAGDSLGVISGFGRAHYQFDGPVDIDARMTNTILIADYNNHRVERYTKDFAYSATITQHDAENAPYFFTDPVEVASDDAGSIYILDGSNKRVVKTKNDLRLDRVIGSYTNTTAPAGSLVNPVHIAVDGFENLIVYDRGTNSLIAYDNLGNLKKHRSLEGMSGLENIKALASRGDTLFALMSSVGPHRLWLFHTGSLTRLGVWDILLDGNTVLRDLDVRNGIAVLTNDRVIRANVSMTTKE
jgi:hypothetical protein